MCLTVLQASNCSDCPEWAEDTFVLQVAEPEDACTNVSVPVLDGKPWIALIVRSERARKDCSFDIKVSCWLTVRESMFPMLKKVLCWQGLTCID